MYTYYDLIKSLSEKENIRGFKRLGLVLKKSWYIQGLTGQEIHDITESIHGTGITPTHVGDLKRGTRTARENTLQRIVPLCFSVKYWEPFEGEEFGKPVLNYQGLDYENTAKQIIMQSMTHFNDNIDVNKIRPKPEDMPDYKYRVKSITDIIDIVIGKHLVSKEAYQMNTPSLVLG